MWDTVVGALAKYGGIASISCTVVSLPQGGGWRYNDVFVAYLYIDGRFVPCDYWRYNENGGIIRVGSLTRLTAMLTITQNRSELVICIFIHQTYTLAL